jgi:hypothetical protein
VSGNISVLKMSAKEAKAYFLTHESYCNLDLPEYFNFSQLLKDVDAAISPNKLRNYCQTFTKSDGKIGHLYPKDFDDVCHTILHNKDGKYAWRPIKLIHPVIYVDLVNRITEDANWSEIKARFEYFGKNPKIHCASIPVQSSSDGNNKASQIIHWWEEIEQKSIELSLDFDFLYRTDITDCYSQIYTHSIAWALHSKDVAKSERFNKDLIGNVIDECLRSMSSGQTNGIPQGSTLSDFIAEIVLGFADAEISDRINDLGKIDNFEEYKILRYRDDYRIFVNNPLHGEKIFQIISKVLFELGLKMNPYKTDSSSNIVKDAVKLDKINWNATKNFQGDPQKHLLLLHDFSQNFPNSGSLATGLDKFYKRIVRRQSLGANILPMIGIVADIAFHNPRCTPICSAILSKLFELIPSKFSRHRVLMRLLRKLRKAPNSGHLEIWIQRISLFIAKRRAKFEEKLCKQAACNPVVIWNSEWLEPELKNIIDNYSVIDSEKMQSMNIKIETSEVALFNSTHGY